jgi:DNA-binding response OmpR family regulator
MFIAVSPLTGSSNVGERIGTERSKPVVNLSSPPELSELRVLLIEDDVSLSHGIATALGQSGCKVDVVHRAEPVIAHLDRGVIDLLILDLGLPDIDGLVLLKAVRERGHRTPVLILSARDQIDDRVSGLNLGADDYLTKPFALNELEARIRALARRTERHGQMRVVGQLSVELPTQRAWISGQPLDLTKRECTLLALLMQQSRMVVPRATLLDAAFPPDSGSMPNALEVQISRIRQKVAPAGVTIRSVRGLGYRIEESQRDVEHPT